MGPKGECMGAAMTAYTGFDLLALGLPELRADEALWTVDALGAAGFEITSYNLIDGGRKSRFTREAFEADAAAVESAGVFYLRIKKGIELGRDSFFGKMDLDRFQKEVTSREVESLLSFSEAAIGRGPTYLQLSLLGEPPEDRWIEYQGLLGMEFPTRSVTGFLGLSPRTYYGPHYVALFGRELLLSTPAALVREVEGGGVQIDLVNDLAGASYDELLDAWSRCTAHLRPAGVFADMSIDEERKRVSFRRGPNFVLAPRPTPKSATQEITAYDRLLASEKDGPIAHLDISGQDLSFKSLDGVQAESLQGAQLNARGSSWRQCFLDCPALGGANFDSAVLDESSMLDPFLVGADFTNASLRHVVWSSALANDSKFDGADLTGAQLGGAAFTGSSFRGARLVGATLEDASFRDCDLREADLSGAKLAGADFAGAKLEGANFDEGVSPHT